MLEPYHGYSAIFESFISVSSIVFSDEESSVVFASTLDSFFSSDNKFN